MIIWAQMTDTAHGLLRKDYFSNHLSNCHVLSLVLFWSLKQAKLSPCSGSALRHLNPIHIQGAMKLLTQHLLFHCFTCISYTIYEVINISLHQTKLRTAAWLQNSWTIWIKMKFFQDWCFFKKITNVKKVGHTQKFMFGIYWWTWKTTSNIKAFEVGQ